MPYLNSLPILRALTPPLLLRAARALRCRLGLLPPPQVVYRAAIGDWDAEAAAAEGWEAASVLDSYKAAWPDYLRGLSEPPDLVRTVYEAALLRAAGPLNSLSVLDYGGGIGWYYALSRFLLPGFPLDYAVKDTSLLIAHGNTLFPQVCFTASDAQCFSRRYDFVLASGSLQYVREWRERALQLAEAASSWLLITRLPVSNQSAFLYRQDAYGTSYPAWAIQEGELIDLVQGAGFRLARCYRLGEPPEVQGAPELLLPSAFLFERVT